MSVLLDCLFLVNILLLGNTYYSPSIGLHGPDVT